MILACEGTDGFGYKRIYYLIDIGGRLYIYGYQPDFVHSYVWKAKPRSNEDPGIIHIRYRGIDYYPEISPEAKFESKLGDLSKKLEKLLLLK